MFLRYSRLGWAVRATAQDRDAAQQMGVDVNRVNQIVFVIASAVGGISGMLVGMYFSSVYPAMGYQAGLKGLVAGLLGGLGNVAGAILGAAALIVLPELLRPFADYRYLIYGIVLLLLIRFRPQGLLGTV